MDIKARYIIFIVLIACNLFTAIFCMQNNSAPFLSDQENLFAAIEYGTVEDVTKILNNGIDVNSLSTETHLTPLGTACQLISIKFEMLQDRINEVYESCCGCLKIESATSNIEDEIDRLETIIMLLSDRTDEPKDLDELQVRIKAYKLLNENSDNIIAFKLRKTLGTWENEFQV